MPESLPFGKNKRLLHATDYKAVFDNVDCKVSTSEILCLGRNNGSDHPRLGLVVAKKNVRLAVQRNRVKRIIRESFRLHQHQIPSYDLIILARKGLGDLSNIELHFLALTIWEKLKKKSLASYTETKNA